MMVRLDAEEVVTALREAHEAGAGRQALLALTARLLHEVGEPYTGVYMYMVDGTRLELEAFAGAPTEHTSIPVGQGLCGRAVREARDLNVPDVRAESEYLACSTTTRSELICLLEQHGEVIGQIDIDSDTPSAFSHQEQAEVRAVADALQHLI